LEAAAARWEVWRQRCGGVGNIALAAAAWRWWSRGGDSGSSGSSMARSIAAAGEGRCGARLGGSKLVKSNKITSFNQSSKHRVQTLF
jgi:hypothetical protein